MQDLSKNAHENTMRCMLLFTLLPIVLCNDGSGIILSSGESSDSGSGLPTDSVPTTTRLLFIDLNATPGALNSAVVNSQNVTASDSKDVIAAAVGSILLLVAICAILFVACCPDYRSDKSENLFTLKKEDMIAILFPVCFPMACGSIAYAVEDDFWFSVYVSCASVLTLLLIVAVLFLGVLFYTEMQTLVEEGFAIQEYNTLCGMIIWIILATPCVGVIGSHDRNVAIGYLAAGGFGLGWLLIVAFFSRKYLKENLPMTFVFIFMATFCITAIIYGHTENIWDCLKWTSVTCLIMSTISQMLLWRSNIRHQRLSLVLFLFLTTLSIGFLVYSITESHSDFWISIGLLFPGMIFLYLWHYRAKKSKMLIVVLFVSFFILVPTYFGLVAYVASQDWTSFLRWMCVGMLITVLYTLLCACSFLVYFEKKARDACGMESQKFRPSLSSFFSAVLLSAYITVAAVGVYNGSQDLLDVGIKTVLATFGIFLASILAWIYITKTEKTESNMKVYVKEIEQKMNRYKSEPLNFFPGIIACIGGALVGGCTAVGIVAGFEIGVYSTFLLFD
eukprot:m.340105 g.340105  ORF g.340105 m.340105 type:complete len:562 (-) comp19135_c0_seq1:69-1754(-)